MLITLYFLLKKEFETRLSQVRYEVVSCVDESKKVNTLDPTQKRDHQDSVLGRGGLVEKGK